MRILTAALLLFSFAAFAVDYQKIEKELTTTGVVGWVHGSVSERELYVFTYRNPEDFFDAAQMSLVTTDPKIRSQLEALTRHDQVRVKGSFMDNPSPQKHIEIKSIEVVKKFESEYPADAYRHDAKIPDELLSRTEANFLVHAIAEGGKVLVVEYKDAVVPIFVRDVQWTKDLHRNDIVTISYALQSYPDRPTHLKFNRRAPVPLKVVEAIKEINGKPADLEGRLIMFPKSPEIKFNVFAIEQERPDGLKRQFTLINFEDQQKFAEIRAALQKAWDKFPGQYDNARNKLISRRLRVRAKGIYNQVSPSQANPQILLKDVDSIQIIEN